MMFRVNSIKHTYWPKEWLIGDQRPEKARTPVTPLEEHYDQPNYLRTLWPDTIIHTGAVENFSLIDRNSIRIQFVSGLDAIQIFSSRNELQNLVQCLEESNV